MCSFDAVVIFHWTLFVTKKLCFIPSSAAKFSSFLYVSSFSFCCVFSSRPFVCPSCVSSVISSLSSSTPVSVSSTSSSTLAPSVFSPSPSASLLASLSALKPSSRASFRGWDFLLEAGRSVSCSCSCSASASSRRRFLAIGQPRMLVMGEKEKTRRKGREQN